MNDAFEDDLLGLAARVARREVSPPELVDAAIARIERAEPLVGGIAVELFEQARAAARAPGAADGPLGGVPYLLKDLGHGHAGVPTTFASDWTRDLVPTADSVFGTRIKRAGLIALATTTVGELAIPASAESRRFGATRNPWDPGRVAGGSSGGAAAAVASGMVPAAHASDQTGSIRIPASCCGLYGLKPSRGRVSSAPDAEDLTGMTTQHAITRTVRDSAVLLDVVAGNLPGDLHRAAPPAGSFLDATQRDPRTLRIALSTLPPSGEPPAPDCVAATEAAARLLEQLGHVVEPAAPELPAEPIGRALATIELVGVAQFAGWMERELGPAKGPLPATIAELVAGGVKIGAVEWIETIASLQRLTRAADAIWERYDLWLTPTLAQPPVPLGELVVTHPAERFFAAHERFTPFAPTANWTGWPAATVPLHWNDDELPIGVQLTAAHGDEALLLSVSAQLERAQPWQSRRAPLSVG
ncbi:amidase [Conexibacter sp. JD483]|uniref:amidase n=1 Tax=unclassified Conexibacter TaxID=2627773 RepID=UPI00271E083E|nr:MULTISPECIES: amidase [unclassified Conexibacter]MDO8184532.1 amidase [Conexibacter sp. CPCC 205706]MDO8197838.1 amidase [Conexibacter sp. CPCC 205762]MDR9369244.1 amidase [Conexibacter sp. JD483]